MSAAVTPGVLHRAARRVLRKIGGGLALRRHVTLLDAGAGANPFVAGVDEPLEIRVGQYLLRQIAAGAGDS